jgi:hypothetical protein
MRAHISILVTLIFTVDLFGQDLGKSDPLVERLYQEITSSYDVQHKYIGCYGSLSTLYKKVDTLKQELGLQSFVEYFNDSSVNLKYYAFLELLALNDNDAFERLTMQSGNSDTINFAFAGQHNDRVKLLDLLTGEYLGFIKMKYYYGGECTYHARSYLFEKRDRRMWRKKYVQVIEFITVKGLSQQWIENYGR